MVNKIQNLARQRAQEFGKTDLVHTLELSASFKQERDHEPSDVVVTTEATKAEAESKNVGRNLGNVDDLKTRPRGFFADQFEVCTSASLESSCS